MIGFRRISDHHQRFVFIRRKNVFTIPAWKRVDHPVGILVPANVGFLGGYLLFYTLVFWDSIFTYGYRRFEPVIRIVDVFDRLTTRDVFPVSALSIDQQVRFGFTCREYGIHIGRRCSLDMQAVCDRRPMESDGVMARTIAGKGGAASQSSAGSDTESGKQGTTLHRTPRGSD
ncbi:hypothetical protein CHINAEXTREME_09290 [Halobiforma lacisalsi AJ5]|uniref:Uncharacterized protein n=1 Tax=Natronobacterium lacisalsi AJ5 TaxID=358396 RepID=M0L7T5_NATLA|nr:hypothetical protein CHINAEXTREME_09290 [Halobiforma lacisalsi AJ5]EMA28514.1 hypothetical protein C445_17856 [Halobiforma lacisalsi AJ5]